MTVSLDEQRRRANGARNTTRVPPHSLEAEQALLGAMLLSTEAIAAAVEILEPGGDAAFYKPAHGHVYTSAVRLWGSSQPVDPVTVADDLRRAELLDSVGGTDALGALVVVPPFTGNAHHYAGTVRDLHQLRQVIAAGAEIAELGYTTTDDVPSVVDAAEQLLFRVSDTRRRRAASHFGTALPAWFDQLGHLHETGTTPGIPTGIVDLDAMLLGLQPGQLVTIGARPGVGKTVVGAHIAREAARNGHPALLVSMEMSEVEMWSRLVSAESRVPLTSIRDAQRLTPKDWERLAGRVIGDEAVRSWPLYVVDEPDQTVMQIKAAARRTASRAGRPLGVIVVDYLQIMSGRRNAENRQVEVAEIARGLKVLAGELQVPVVALSQLSRALEGRMDKRPGLADFRETGEIENASDVVIGAYRDEMYRKDTPDKGVMELIVLKQRNGPTGVVTVAFFGQYVSIANMAPAT